MSTATYDLHVERPRVARRRSVPDLGVLGWLALGWIVLIVLVTIFAGVVAPKDPNATDILHLSQGPTGAHLLGTDNVGRDLLSRLFYGGRQSLVGAGLVVLLGTIVGAAIAVTSAWIGGRFDAVASRLIDIGFAFPALLIAILAVAVFGAGITAPVIALAIAYVPFMARILRSAAVRERAMPYISACEVQGLSPVSTCVRHIMPNILPLVVVQATVTFGYALIDLASLSFLGLGVQPPASDWGRMVSDGQQDILAHHPEQSLFASVAILLTVLAFLALGERLNTLQGGRR